MLTTLTLIIILTNGSSVQELKLPFESSNDCQRTKGLVEQYVPGAKAECRWGFKAAPKGKGAEA